MFTETVAMTMFSETTATAIFLKRLPDNEILAVTMLQLEIEDGHQDSGAQVYTISCFYGLPEMLIPLLFAPFDCVVVNY